MSTIPTATVAKNVASSFRFITRLRMIASGKESPAIDIMNARDVPSGTPFAVMLKISGTTVEQPA